MVGLLTILKEFITDQEFQRLTTFVVFILFIGALFYNQVEGWGWLDSFYFCVTTLTTVGYGDFVPATSSGKIFTIFYIIIGLGVLLGYVNIVAKIAIDHKFGLLGVISSKTKDLGQKTWNIGKRVKVEEAEQVEEEEEEPVVKKPPQRRQPMRRYPVERLK